MSKVLLNTQNELLSCVLQKQLFGCDFDVHILNSAESLLPEVSHTPFEIAVLEVNEMEAWSIRNRIAQIKKMKRIDQNIKVILMVDENKNPKETEEVIELKMSRLIDEFLYTSVSGNYFLGVMKSLQ